MPRPGRLGCGAPGGRGGLTPGLPRIARGTGFAPGLDQQHTKIIIRRLVEFVGGQVDLRPTIADADHVTTLTWFRLLAERTLQQPRDN
jgi:hypothetical protein